MASLFTPFPFSLSPLTPKRTESKSTRETQPTRFMLSGGWAWQKLVSLPFARVSLSAPAENLRIYIQPRCFEPCCTRIHACCIFLYLSLFFSIFLSLFLFFFSPHPLSARRRAWMQKGWRKGRKVERVGGESFETSSHDFVPSRKRAFHPLFFRDWHALNAG